MEHRQIFLYFCIYVQGFGMAEPSSPGDEFEPTAEMMVNDFDDERTLDEEEALEEADDQQNELSNLEKEKDMPIEALLAMYGYNDDDDGGQEGSQSSSSEEILTNQDLTLDNPETGSEQLGEEQQQEQQQQEQEREQEQEQEQEEEEEEEVNTEEMAVTEPESVAEQPSEVVEMECEEEEKEVEPPSMLHELYKDDPTVIGGSRHLRSGSRQHSEEEEDEEEDCDYSPEEEDWKKTIMVGSDYQATIPEGVFKYDDAMPYENEDKLLWDPSTMPEKDVMSYLGEVQDIQTASTQGVDAIPRGSHVRDDEQSLYLLLQCGHNKEEAIRRQKINATSTTDTMSLWSEEECRNFETGLRQYGKDFHLIQQNRVRTRSVSELVQFYYLWKKTERHDVFANKARLEKKKYTLHPGTTDFMERFLDEQDSPVSSPSVHSLLSGDPKRQSRTPPPNYSDSSDMITVDEARLISSHFEDIARHLDKESYESLCKLAAGAKPPNGLSSNATNDTVGVSISRSSAAFISPSETLITHTNNAQSFAQ
ncbi:unnamed protein product [Allacma fusca]|uniref:Mesoderm induction early response protein 1 n=1 Tax=Allacma fusca TaxID=39272 RepID=A0A8J2PP00_9HEXA|nr:unnamed protein product [Allacma fusca]